MLLFTYTDDMLGLIAPFPGLLVFEAPVAVKYLNRIRVQFSEVNSNGRIFVFQFKFQQQGDLLVNSKLLRRLIPRVQQQCVHLIARRAYAVKLGFKSHDSFCGVAYEHRSIVTTTFIRLTYLVTAFTFDLSLNSVIFSIVFLTSAFKISVYLEIYERRTFS